MVTYTDTSIKPNFKTVIQEISKQQFNGFPEMETINSNNDQLKINKNTLPDI